MKRIRGVFFVAALGCLILGPAVATFAQAAPAAAPMKFDLGNGTSPLTDAQVRQNLTLAASTANNAWLITAAALVLMMTIPGLALFYGGMVKRKNVLSVLMQSFAATCVVSVLWVIIGFSLAFSPGHIIPGFIGDFRFAFMMDWAAPGGPQYLGNLASIWTVSQGNAPINALVFVMFQCMFAIITPALIIGAYAERFRFSHFLAFTSFWLIFVYCPIAHEVWSADGWLFNLGALDFAGGTVVHMNAGIAGLVAAIVLGRRKKPQTSPPHSLVFTVIGASLLWVGWFGFNAGSGLAADGVAGSAFMVTNTATAMAAITWMVLDRIFAGKATVLGAATGAVAGLVAITPASGFVSLPGALAIGIAVSLACYAAVVLLKKALKYDDTLDAFGVHGIGGLVGCLFTGLFADPAVWSAVGGSYAGVFYGNPGQFVIQLADAGLATLITGVGTFIIMGILKLLGAKSSESDQAIGLDIVEHNERAYTLVE